MPLFKVFSIPLINFIRTDCWKIKKIFAANQWSDARNKKSLATWKNKLNEISRPWTKSRKQNETCKTNHAKQYSRKLKYSENPPLRPPVNTVTSLLQLFLPSGHWNYDLIKSDQWTLIDGQWVSPKDTTRLHFVSFAISYRKSNWYTMYHCSWKLRMK